MAKQSEIRGLAPTDSAISGAAKIIWTRFNEMWDLRGAVIESFDIEAVHDMRVASRRLRTVMQTFRQCFGKKSFGDHYRCIKDLADLLGEVRDRDVLIEELEGNLEAVPADSRSALELLLDNLRKQRRDARKELQRTVQRLDGEAYDRRFLSDLARYL